MQHFASPSGHLHRRCLTAQETFLEGAFSIATYNEGSTYLLPSSTQSASYQAKTSLQVPHFSRSAGVLPNRLAPSLETSR